MIRTKPWKEKWAQFIIWLMLLGEFSSCMLHTCQLLGVLLSVRLSDILIAMKLIYMVYWESADFLKILKLYKLVFLWKLHWIVLHWESVLNNRTPVEMSETKRARNMWLVAGKGTNCDKTSFQNAVKCVFYLGVM